MAKRSQTGICRLTGLPGTFVRSHLLPKSLTRLPTGGKFRIEAGDGRRPIPRFDGWFDDELVVAEGEQILQRIDDRGVKALRASRLIWSSWSDRSELEPIIARDSVISYRTTSPIDGEGLRLFFLSLLWRAAATARPEFAGVSLSDSDRERLRACIAAENCPEPKFCPIVLTQLISHGDPHNRTPYTFDDAPYEIGGNTIQPTCVRFYFDGLIARIYHAGTNAPPLELLGPAAVGNGAILFVPALTYEMSRQKADMEHTIEVAESKWPGVVSTFKK